MKHRGHVYMAHLIHEELCRNKGELEIKTIPDDMIFLLMTGIFQLNLYLF